MGMVGLLPCELPSTDGAGSSKAIRERLRLHGGETIDIDERGGMVEIQAAPTDVHVKDAAEGRRS